MASAPKQISEFPDAGALSATDYILLQQGATGTALSKAMLGPILDTPHTTMTVSGAGSVSGNLTVGNAKFVVTAASGNTTVAGTLGVTGASTLAALSATTIAGTTGAFSGDFAVATNKFTVAAASGETAVAGSVTGASFIPFSSSLPTNGMYLPAANTLGWAVNTAAEMQMTGTALSPATSDGLALGTTTLMWSDAFFASGAVLNFNNGNVTITHSAAALGIAGATVTVTRNSTDGSGTTTGLSILGAQSVAHTGTFYGASVTPSYSASSGNTLAAMYGVSSTPVNTGTGTVAAFFGVRGQPINSSGGAVNSMRAVDGISQNTSTGTVTDMYGVFARCDNSNAGGTVTNAYGFYVAAPVNSGTMVNRWGLYQVDTASNNFLAGRTLIGTTTDDGVNKLRVSGGVTVDTGNSYKVNNVAVVGATKTGWTAATGTATRTTFVTSTVTTEQLAQRVKALLDDLISHGLIGT